MPLRKQGRKGHREDERHRPKQKTAKKNDHFEFLLQARECELSGEGAPFVPTTEDQIEQTHTRLKLRPMPPAGTFAHLHEQEPGFGYLVAVSEPVALAARKA
jgi:hypothetical protein